MSKASNENTDAANVTGLSDDASFETMLGGLKKIVDGLERGEMALEDALFAYERGVSLVRKAQTRLDDMEARLLKLTESGELKPLE